MPITDFKDVLEVDLVGSFFVSTRVVPKMIERLSGKVINIFSMMSEYGHPFYDLVMTRIPAAR